MARAVILEQFLHRTSTERQQQASEASPLPLHSTHAGSTESLPRQGEQAGPATFGPQPQLQHDPDPVPGRQMPTQDRDVWCGWPNAPIPIAMPQRLMHAR